MISKESGTSTQAQPNRRIATKCPATRIPRSPKKKIKSNSALVQTISILSHCLFDF